MDGPELPADQKFYVYVINYLTSSVQIMPVCCRDVALWAIFVICNVV